MNYSRNVALLKLLDVFLARESNLTQTEKRYRNELASDKAVERLISKLDVS